MYVFLFENPSDVRVQIELVACALTASIREANFMSEQRTDFLIALSLLRPPSPASTSTWQPSHRVASLQ